MGNIKDLKDKYKKPVEEINENLDLCNRLLTSCLDTIQELELEKNQRIRSMELLQHHIQKLELELRNQADLNQIQAFEA